MEQIKDIVKNVIEKLSTQNAAQNQLQGAWQEAVGKKVFKHTQIEAVKYGKILIKVDSPTAMFHLNLKRRQILKELQKIDKTLSIIELRAGKVQ
jgi:predicted nucleic acid-binding Zn ribbon protein